MKALVEEAGMLFGLLLLEHHNFAAHGGGNLLVTCAGAVNLQVSHVAIVAIWECTIYQTLVEEGNASVAT